VLKRKFTEICNPRGNVIMERHEFNTQIQKEGESFQSFVADLRILANTCEYGILKDKLICDKIVCGVSSRHVCKQLLKEPDLTLDRAIDIGIANELSGRNNTELLSIQKNRFMVSTKEVYRRKILNLVSKIVGIVVVIMQLSRNHVQRLARNVFIAESPTISRKFAVLNVMVGVQALEIVHSVPGVLLKRPINNILLDKMRIYLLSMQLRPRKERKVKFTAQWKSTANQLKLKLISRNEKIDKTKAVQLVAYDKDTLTTMGSAMLKVHLKVHHTTDAFRTAILQEYKDLFQGNLGNIPVVYKMRLDANVTRDQTIPQNTPCKRGEC